MLSKGPKIEVMSWDWSWVQTASGGGFCRIAKADSGLRSPHRRRLPTTNSNPFTGSAPERNTVGPGLLAKTVPVWDPWRSSISSIACASRSLSGFTVRRTERRFSACSNLQAADPSPPWPSAPATRTAIRIPTGTATGTSQRLPRNPRLA